MLIRENKHGNKRGIWRRKNQQGIWYNLELIKNYFSATLRDRQEKKVKSAIGSKMGLKVRPIS
jgi:hypothetical protein